MLQILDHPTDLEERYFDYPIYRYPRVHGSFFRSLDLSMGPLFQHHLRVESRPGAMEDVTSEASCGSGGGNIGYKGALGRPSMTILDPCDRLTCILHEWNLRVLSYFIQVFVVSQWTLAAIAVRARSPGERSFGDVIRGCRSRMCQIDSLVF